MNSFTKPNLITKKIWQIGGKNANLNYNAKSVRATNVHAKNMLWKAIKKQTKKQPPNRAGGLGGSASWWS